MSASLASTVLDYTDGVGIELASVPIGDLEPSPFNPNAMDEQTFNRLADELEDVGFIDPIQVIPWHDGASWTEGKFRIIGGEHRFRAAQILGFNAVPAVLLTDERWHSEDRQKFVTVRLNALHGKIDPHKFLELYEDVAKRHEKEELQAMFGVTDDAAWKEYLKQVRKDLKGGGADKNQLDKFDKESKELKTIDDLSALLNRIFNEVGDQLEQNFMIFTYGAKQHIYCAIDPKHFRKLQRVLGDLNGRNAQPLFERMVDFAARGTAYSG